MKYPVLKRHVSLMTALSVAVLFFSLVFAQEYREVSPETKVSIPGDFHFKDEYRVQWWYFTGHLINEKGREFGYELTFFVVNVQARDYKSEFGVKRIYISHFAISDLENQAFLFSDRADTDAYQLAGAEKHSLKVWVGKNILEGDMKKLHIQAEDSEKALNLFLVPEKPLVLNGKNGYSRKSSESPLNASLYFSYPSMKTRGTIKIGKDTYTVKGKTWFDRELSSRGLSKDQQGWDWFAIQLDDNREIMLYLIRKKDSTTDSYSSGTLVYSNGAYRHLPKDDFKVTVLDHYLSPKSRARYPSLWEITIPSEKLSLRIMPSLQNQEVLAQNTTGNYYWEGTCTVEGTAKGRAYVEMTGY
jgi:predicted secreted hydrolase